MKPDDKKDDSEKNRQISHGCPLRKTLPSQILPFGGRVNAGKSFDNLTSADYYPGVTEKLNANR